MWVLTVLMVGEPLHTYTYISLNFSSTSQYRMTGLSPSTKYLIFLTLYMEGYWCTYALSYSAIAETMSGEFHLCLDNTQVCFSVEYRITLVSFFGYKDIQWNIEKS